MLFATPVITACALVATAALGLCMGSLLNRWAWRIVHHEPVLRGRSRCPGCGHALVAREHVCMALYLVVVLRYGLTLEAAQMLVFASCLFLLSLTDLEDYLIPNGAIVAAALARLAYIATTPAPLALLSDSLVAAAVVLAALLVLVLIADRVLGRDSMGGGDLKLFAVAGLYFGLAQTLLLVVLACILGIAFGLATSGEKDEDSLARPFPFGPSIALACVSVMLVGGPVVGWYLGLV